MEIGDVRNDNKMNELTERWKMLVTTETIQIFEKYESSGHAKPKTRRIKVTISIPTDVETIFHILLDLDSTRKTWDQTFSWGNILHKIDNNEDIVQFHSKPIFLGCKAPFQTVIARRRWKKFRTGQLLIQTELLGCKEQSASETKNMDQIFNNYTWMVSPSREKDLVEKENRSSFKSTVVYYVNSGQLRRGKYLEDIKFYILEIMRGLEVYSETKSFRSTVALLNQFNSPKNSTTSFGSLPSGEKHLTEDIASAENNCWYSPESKNYMVRGKSYLADGIKVPAKSNLGELVGVDWFIHSERIDNVCSHSCSKELELHARINNKFIFAVNIQVPGSKHFSIVFYYLIPSSFDKNSVFGKFINGDDAYRNARFKLIPNIPKGPWIVQRAVGNKPLIVGGALKAIYTCTGHYFEVDIDIGSSAVANSIVRFVLGYVRNLVVDLCFLVEGKTISELPEELIGTSRISFLDPDSAKPFA